MSIYDEQIKPSGVMDKLLPIFAESNPGKTNYVNLNTF
jgi:hypothetical protein